MLLAIHQERDNGFHRHHHPRPAHQRLRRHAPHPTITGKVEFQPLDQENDNAPTHRIVLENGYELGAAWTKTKKDTGEEYLSLKLDAPEFPAPIYPGLGRKPGTDPKDKVFSIIWNRQNRRSK